MKLVMLMMGPAATASAAPNPNASMRARRTSMPQASATSGFCDVARMVLPCDVGHWPESPPACSGKFADHAPAWPLIARPDRQHQGDDGTDAGSRLTQTLNSTLVPCQHNSSKT